MLDQILSSSSVQINYNKNNYTWLAQVTIRYQSHKTTLFSTDFIKGGGWQLDYFFKYISSELLTGLTDFFYYRPILSHCRAKAPFSPSTFRDLELILIILV